MSGFAWVCLTLYVSLSLAGCDADIPGEHQCLHQGQAQLCASTHTHSRPRCPPAHLNARVCACARAHARTCASVVCRDFFLPCCVQRKCLDFWGQMRRGSCNGPCAKALAQNLVPKPWLKTLCQSLGSKPCPKALAQNLVRKPYFKSFMMPTLELERLVPKPCARALCHEALWRQRPVADPKLSRKDPEHQPPARRTADRHGRVRRGESRAAGERRQQPARNDRARTAPVHRWHWRLEVAGAIPREAHRAACGPIWSCLVMSYKVMASHNHARYSFWPCIVMVDIVFGHTVYGPI